MWPHVVVWGKPAGTVSPHTAPQPHALYTAYLVRLRLFFLVTIGNNIIVISVECMIFLARSQNAMMQLKVHEVFDHLFNEIVSNNSSFVLHYYYL